MSSGDIGVILLDADWLIAWLLFLMLSALAFWKYEFLDR
jgi:hypothetical protein